jgi:mRNA-degrading endonuclease RelE of RelBE toxin-antitoxin system
MVIMVEVRLTADAFDELDDLPRDIRTRMMKLVERLRSYPEVSGVKWLTGNLAGKGRLRTGDYRMQFSVGTIKTIDQESGEETEDVVITIDKVGHRDGFYEG